MTDPVRHWIVYMYTFPNDKKYIGKTYRSLQERQGADFKQYKRCTLLWKAIQKYGCDAIKQDILFEDDCTAKVASDVEAKYIEEHKTNANKYTNPAYGYNLTSGGDGLTAWHPSPERYKKLCKQLRESFAAYAANGIPDTTRQKMSAARLGRKFGPLSEEHKRKLSIANSRENMTWETHVRKSNAKKKKLLVTNMDTGEQTIYDSVTDAGIAFGVKINSVSRWCTGSRNVPKRIGNYKFEYYTPPTTTEREDCETTQM